MNEHLSSEQTPENKPAYTIIATIYDHIMSHVNYYRWAKYIIDIMKKEHLWSGRRLLDIGCGTGKFLKEMERLGQLGDGCDPSQGMLGIARKRLLDANLYTTELPGLESVPEAQYQIVTCLYDTMNYLDTKAEFIASLNRVYDMMKAPGLFVFDVVSEALCRDYFQDYSDSERLSETLAYARESHYDAETRKQYNWISIYTPEGVFKEEHCQYIYPFRDVKRYIREHTNFELIAVYEDFSFDPASERSERAHFVLRKTD